jgi:hypothetical protein
MDIVKKFIKQASAETPRKIELIKDEDSGRLMFLNKFRQGRIIVDLSIEDYQTLLQLINSNVQDNVEIVDTYTSLPDPGDSETIYVVQDSTAMYIYDTTISDYVLLNNPDVVNPDAPEEGTIYYVKLATISTLNACTYNNGTAGVGATLTGNMNGILSETQFTGRIDNVVPLLGDIILVKNQASALQNGIYEVTTLGDVSTQFVLTRIDGYDQTSEVAPSTVSVSEGFSNANRFFNQRTVNPTIGTSDLEFVAYVVNSSVIPTLFVDTATSAPLPACTYAIGTTYATLPGWGATLTANANGALGTINGVSMTSNRRIIVKDQVNQAHNGTYSVISVGSLSQPWVLRRIDSSSTVFYLNREFVVSNINSTLFGDRYTVSSPLSMLNSAWGTTNIVFTKNVSSVNLYNADGTLTGNRVVNYNGYNLTFGVANFGGTLKTISPSSSALDTAFAVRNNTDTTDLINVDGTGVVRFYQNLYGFGINYMESIKNPFFLTSGLVIGSGINYNSRGEIGSAYTSHDFTTQNLVTSAGSFLMKISNFTTLHYSMNKDGVENKPTMPTYADNASALVGGLVVGDEYKTATGERRIVV